MFGFGTSWSGARESAPTADLARSASPRNDVREDEYVLLVYPRLNPDQPDPRRPLGLPLSVLTLARALLAADVDVVILDQNVTPRVDEELARLPRPLFVGLSCMGGEQIATARGLAAKVGRRWPGTPRVWGGWGPTLTPEIYTHATSAAFVDALVAGRGEVPVVELARQLADGLGFDGVPGVSWRAADGSVRTNPPGPVVDPHANDALPYHLVEANWDRYTTGTGVFNYISAYGCPHRCAFCSAPVMTRSFHATPNEHVVEHLREAVRRGARSIVFFDDNFFTSRPRVLDLAQRMIDADLGVQWYSNGRIDQISRLDVDELRLLRRSGVTYLNIGYETGDQEVSDSVKKDIDVAQVHVLAARCRDAGIGLSINFIMGLPGETPEALVRSLETLKQIYAVQPDILVYWFVYLPCPGTALWDEHLRDGIMDAPTTMDEMLRVSRYGTEEAGFFTRPSAALRLTQTKHQAIAWYFFAAYAPFTGPAWRRPADELLRRWCRLRFERRWFRLRFDWRLAYAIRRSAVQLRWATKAAARTRLFHALGEQRRRGPKRASESMFSTLFGNPPVS